MDLQGRIILSYGIMAAAVLAVFIFVGLRSRGPVLAQDAVTPRGYAIRRWWFWILLVVLVVGFALTLPFFPYGAAQAEGEATHITVIARQYSFDDLPASVPLGVPVVFDVTSADVNHGFAIYDPEDQLIAQVQAMPDYVNHLPVTFRERGHYTVRCLEYCGLGHPVMQAGFEVE